MQFLRQDSKRTIENQIHDILPFEYNRCISGLEEIIKESWLIATKAEKTGNDKERLSSLTLIKDTYSTKMDLLTNASLLKDSINFIQKSKEKLDSLDQTTLADQEGKQQVLTTKF